MNKYANVMNIIYDIQISIDNFDCGWYNYFNSKKAKEYLP